MESYNSEHGTDHTPLSFYGSATCTTFDKCATEYFAEPIVIVDNDDFDRRLKLTMGFAAAALQNAAEMGCTVGDTVPVIMSADEVQNIALRIGPDVKPLF